MTVSGGLPGPRPWPAPRPARRRRLTSSEDCVETSSSRGSARWTALTRQAAKIDVGERDRRGGEPERSAEPVARVPDRLQAERRPAGSAAAAGAAPARRTSRPPTSRRPARARTPRSGTRAAASGAGTRRPRRSRPSSSTGHSIAERARRRRSSGGSPPRPTPCWLEPVVQAGRRCRPRAPPGA